MASLKPLGTVPRSKAMQYLTDIASAKMMFSTNNIGTPAVIGNTTPTSPGGVSWKSAAPIAVVANQWIATNAQVFPFGGSIMIIHRVYFEVTGACEVGLSHRETDTGGTNSFTLTGTFCDYTQSAVGAGTMVFDFSDNPLIIRYGETLRAFYSVDGILSVNYQVKFSGIRTTGDFNFDADFEVGFMGDSFCNVNETAAPEYTNIDGVETGLWTVMVQNFLNDNGISCFRTNIGQGGSDSDFWRLRVRNGLFRRYKPDILFCNLLINNSVTSVTSGTAKAGYKEIIRGYFKYNPNGCFVMLNVEDTDIAANNATVPSGEFAGQNLLVALRTIAIQVQSELKTQNPTWDLLIADTTPTNPAMYTRTNTDNYIETVAGTLLHPNVAKGQPKIANVVNLQVQANSVFYNTNKTT